MIYDLDNYSDCQNMQSPFLDVAALFSAAVKTGLFGAGMLWQCLEPIWVGLLARLQDASFGCPVWVGYGLLL